MKPEDIRRIAEIIGLEPKCSEDGPFVCLVRDKDKHAVNFQPDTHWYSTGMLLEWFFRNDYPFEFCRDDFEKIRCEVVVYVDGNGYCKKGETLQLAICNAVLSVGEEE